MSTQPQQQQQQQQQQQPDKALEGGASAALKTADLGSGIHEDPSRGREPGQSDKTPLFDAQGAIGKQFTTQGSIGGTAQKLGGPFAETGAVGRQFKPDGAVGGAVQENLGSGTGGSEH